MLNSTDVYDRNVSGNNTVEISEVPAKVDDLVIILNQRNDHTEIVKRGVGVG